MEQDYPEPVRKKIEALYGRIFDKNFPLAAIFDEHTKKTLEDTPVQYWEPLVDICTELEKMSPFAPADFMKKSRTTLEGVPERYKKPLLETSKRIAKHEPSLASPFFYNSPGLFCTDDPFPSRMLEAMDRLADKDAHLSYDLFLRTNALLKRWDPKNPWDTDHLLIEYVHDQQSAHAVSQLIDKKNRKDYMQRVQGLGFY